MHAFSIDSDHLRFSNLDGSLILRTQLGFLAKNQLPSRAPDSIIIPRLSNFCRKSDNFITACYALLELLRFILIRPNHSENVERGFLFLLKEIRI